ncbi:hypothetical protein OE88DRAFT_1655501 [Heliocybe sulcata]|uniref:Uncharacterized protein n=1 Tax=Heliocybe sulcata TaxID=5364 RepID=A0A5C3N6G2_9AGAM|nr:hypothetical protein OE88DRAFT_1655501 [Heliocybe sulcata]
MGLVSQLRRYHLDWYRRHNYILGGAFDGGSQIMIFVLSFAVFGVSGVKRPFPTVSGSPLGCNETLTFIVGAGNPATGNVDYCSRSRAIG